MNRTTSRCKSIHVECIRANQKEIKSKSNDDKKKNKKENKNNNLNTLSSNEDNGASTEYGNSEINECIEIIKSFN